MNTEAHITEILNSDDDESVESFKNDEIEQPTGANNIWKKADFWGQDIATKKVVVPV